MNPEELFQQFIQKIAARIETGGTYDEGIIDVVLAQRALRRALKVLLDARSDEDEVGLDIPDGWPPE